MCKNKIKNQSLDPQVASILSMIGMWTFQAVVRFFATLGIAWLWKKFINWWKKVDKNKEKE